MSAYSIIVVTWECAGRLRRLVESMNRHLDGSPELVVVDNASSDDPEGAAREWRGPTRFIGLDRNAGFGAGSNSGVEAASHERVVMLNPDTELLDSGLGRLAEFALRRGALAGPKLLNPDGTIQPSASGSPVGPWPWLGAVVPGALQPERLRARTEPWRMERTTRVAWLTGACVAGPRRVLLGLGPFDPAIHLYGEDMELGLRAANEGVASYFCPDVCRLVHEGGGSTRIAFPRGGQVAVAANRRAVLRRAYGARRERAAWLAQRLNLRLRVLAKRALGRDAKRDRAALDAARRARIVTEHARSATPPG